MKYLVAVLAFVLPLAAQTVRLGAGVNPNAAASMTTAPNDAPKAVRPEDKCSIEGTVVSATTGEPLKKAHLYLRPMGAVNGIPYGTVTDSSGRFTFDNVDPGRYNFTATRNGYVMQGYSPQGGTNRNAMLTLANGQTLKEVVFKLTPQGVITGRVVDEDGEPLANVMIQCMTFGYQRGRRQLMPSNGMNTNDLGEFRLHGLRPGKYIISATYRSPDMYMPVERIVGSPQAAQAADEGYAMTYYPNTTSAESASRIEIVPGAVIQGIDMRLVRTRTVRIKGHITTGFATKGRRNANVMLMSRDGVGFGAPRAFVRPMDGQGNFEMRGVAPGSYILSANYIEDSKAYSARMPIEVGNSNIEGIELTLAPPAEIQGRIVIEDNGDLKAASVNVNLMPRSPGPIMGGVGSPVGDKLVFKLSNVTPDPYDVSVYGLPENFYIKSIRMGDQDVTDTGVDFTQGVPAGEMTVVLNPNGGQIEGTVQNSSSQPAAGVTVTLIPDASHRSVAWLYKSTSTDQNGHFTMKGVRPGDYKLYAWEEIEPGAYQDPEYVKPYESAGEALSVKESAHENVQLKVVPSEKTAAQTAASR